ncbi:hypothetical protein [Acetobacter orientalis]|uniref:Uncharacterized protein n=5 Tax=Acetobacter orientalis TaxID=146474 RepID=A0A0D6NM07_9PROT|nr:hypothetical protein [Acetobacter orientalis]MDN6040611.1 hypothetical protein [Acetobacter sp.]MCP1215839.1 hypothetical protein [Acetobacter orientalis]MCP1218001.1 hypothetical protein [Acetobacter orientalis]GAN67084.1 hypothetical protein Abor_037_030 [Acetobacter orientalis]GEL60498.1 hypothetical protein AOR02nite_03400 [Acetobacter orientalis]
MRHSLPVAIALIAGNISMSAVMERTTNATPPPTPPLAASRRVLPHCDIPKKTVVITSDSVKYCNALIQTIDTHQNTALPPIIQQMRDDGADLCRKGMVRSGIVRLRRALIAVKRTDTP